MDPSKEYNKWDLSIPNYSKSNPVLLTENAQRVLAVIRQRYSLNKSQIPTSYVSMRLAQAAAKTNAEDLQRKKTDLPSSSDDATSLASQTCLSSTTSSIQVDVLKEKQERKILPKPQHTNGTVNKIPEEKRSSLAIPPQKVVSEPLETSVSAKKIDSKNKPSSNYQILSVESITQEQRSKLEKALLQAEEVACTLVFSDNSSQLRTYYGCQKKRRLDKKTPELSGIAFAFPWSESSSTPNEKASTSSQIVFVRFPIKTSVDGLAEWTRNVISQVMESETRKICYNSQEIINCLQRIYEYDSQTVCSKWIFMDVRTASWLLDPDNPPKEYCQLLQKLDLSLTSQDEREKNELLCLDLSSLGPAILTLYNRLQEQDLWDLYWNLEMPLSPILAMMETQGIQVDAQALIDASNILKKRITKVEAEAHKAAGHPFLINSSHQLRQVLFDELKLDSKCKKTLAKTASNSYTSTSEGVLLDLQDLHPLPKLVLEYRQLVKLRSTYFDGMLPFIKNLVKLRSTYFDGMLPFIKNLVKLRSTYFDGMLPFTKNGLIHTTWEHTGAATGRVTSANPNLQNVPKQPIELSYTTNQYIVGKEEELIKIFPREAYKSKEGWSFVAADFQAIELRLLAHLSNDPSLLMVFNDKNSSDVFTTLTSQWLGVQPEEVQFQEREQTKRIVYSVIYGVGRDRLAKTLGVSADKAKDFMTSFLEKFPGISVFTRKCIEECKRNGFVSTILKRKRWFPHINAQQFNIRSQAERQAVNFTVQGSAADICKSSMIQVVRAIQDEPSLQARLLLQIHDELLLEVPDKDIPRLKDLLKSTMESSGKPCLKVPLQVSISTGKKWSHMTVC